MQLDMVNQVVSFALFLEECAVSLSSLISAPLMETEAGGTRGIKHFCSGKSIFLRVVSK